VASVVSPLSQENQKGKKKHDWSTMTGVSLRRCGDIARTESESPGGWLAWAALALA
jgi:hypothetical protein